MPRVRILTPIATMAASYSPGDEVDLPKEMASQWCDGVRAELVRGQRAEVPESTKAGGRRRAPKAETTDGDADPA